MSYGADFYQTIRRGCQDSAAVIAPILVEALGVKSAIDVGAGEGWFAEAMQECGCRVLAVEGEHVTPVVDHRHVDLEQPLPDLGRFEVALCLEVAEHLTPGRAASFVADLCRLADIVVFSAAIPGQGGTGHLNEQLPTYWVDLFRANGYASSGALRWRIWEDERVENWYRMNLMVAAKRPEHLPAIFDTPLAPMWPVVHPVLFDARRT